MTWPGWIDPTLSQRTRKDGAPKVFELCRRVCLARYEERQDQ